jgi:hypothetical protein
MNQLPKLGAHCTWANRAWLQSQPETIEVPTLVVSGFSRTERLRTLRSRHLALIGVYCQEESWVAASCDAVAIVTGDP